jgi:uncharacterized membrane protein
MSVSTQKGFVAFLAVHRLEALVDGVFAIVMTLLVLEISIPEIVHPSLHAELPRRLLELWPKLYSYVLSFLVLGILWSLHHRSFHSIKRSDSGLIWLNIVFLMFVALIPFSTSLLGNYGTEQLSIVIYAINIILAVAMRLIIWIYATGKYRLVDSDTSPRLIKWDKSVQIGFLFCFMLVIGISFLNVNAAFSVLVLLLVVAIVMQLIIPRRLEQ